MAIAESFQAQPSSHQIRLPQDSEYSIYTIPLPSTFIPVIANPSFLFNTPEITPLAV